MKKAQRQPYHALADELTGRDPRASDGYEVDLCSLCQFMSGDACTHLLECVRDHGADMTMVRGLDCWVFRPAGTVEKLRQVWLDDFEDRRQQK